MKRILYTIAMVAAAVLALASCEQETLSPESVIKDSRVETNDFDRWLEVNFLKPYNIEFKYRYDMMETALGYWTVPADFDQSVMYAHLVKYLCVDSYDEVAGTAFTCSYFPKLFFLEGTFHYDNNGTMILGTAEGGRKIFLAGTNHLRYYLEDAIETQESGTLNEFYFKTIHHEFTHILNQTKDFTADFKLVTGSDYVLDSWNNTDGNHLKRGFISDYSQKSDHEDFAEMLSCYVVNTPEQWDQWMSDAGTEGAAKLAKKLEYVKNYMLEAWNIDLDELRTTVLRRTGDVLAAKVDLTDLTI